MNVKKELDKPAIVENAESAKLASLLDDMKRLLVEAEQTRVKGAEHFRALGELLLAFSKIVGQGWQKLASEHLERDPSQLRRWVRLAKSTDEDLGERWRIINGHYDEIDDEQYVPVMARKPGQECWCTRCVNIGKQTPPNCPKCAEVKRQNKAGVTRGANSPANPAVFNEKQWWSSFNKIHRNSVAFAEANKLAEDPVYVELTEAIAKVKAKFNELKEKGGADQLALA